MKFGCQTYTWQMSYDRYKDRMLSILDVIRDSGFAGVEAEVCMLGELYDSPSRFHEELSKRNLQLAALTLALPWLHNEESEEEKREADRIISFLKQFSGTMLILVQLPGLDRSHLQERQQHALNGVNEVARRATDQGLICAYHPNSPAGSVFRTQEDYRILFDGLNQRVIGYAPDSGHIANGGMDPLQVFKDMRSIIRHVHFKDFDSSNQWRKMGEGSIDHPEIIRGLRDSGYSGWVMVEEESEQAEQDPDGVTLHNGLYVHSELLKLLN